MSDGRDDDGGAVTALTALTALRQCLLAVSVVHDVDLLPASDGVTVTGYPEIPVSFAEIAGALGDIDPSTPRAHARVDRWLRLRRAIADRSLEELAETIRPVGLPIGHELHPGPSWVRQPVLGGCLDLRAGTVGEPQRGTYAEEPHAVRIDQQVGCRRSQASFEPWSID